MARVQLTRHAVRQFQALPQNLRDPVLNTLTDLEIHPQDTDRPLLGRLKGLWSARVGSYRVIYSIEGSRRSPMVIVRAIKHLGRAYE